MPSTRYLLQAAAGRLSVRLGASLADSTARLLLLAQDLPDMLQRDLALFWDEVALEAERLARDGSETPSWSAAPSSAPSTSPSTAPSTAASTEPSAAPSAASSAVPSAAPPRPSRWGQRSGARAADPQEQIDELRAQVAGLSRRLDGAGS